MVRIAAGVDVETVVDAGALIGEGPLWDPQAGRLLWVDIAARALHSYDPRGGTDVAVSLPLPVGCVALRRSGGLAFALSDGFWICEDSFRNLRRVAAVEDDRPDTRMNDGKVDPWGRFWAGTMSLRGAEGAGALYRLELDHSVSVALAPVSLSNGMDWSTDGRTMYYVDTPRQTVDAFCFDGAQGRMSDRRTLVAVAPQDGVPDGLCVDVEDHIWLAVWGAGEVRRYSPGGELVMVIELPAAQVSSVAFGGPDLTDLYVTSAAEGLDSEQRRRQPQAGALFRCRPGPRGRQAHLFDG